MKLPASTNALLADFPNSLPGYLPQALREAARQITLRRGQSLFSVNDPIKWLYYVADGEVRLVHFMPNGDEVVLQSVTSGNALAECSICLDQYTCMAEATRQSIVLAVPLDLFNRLLGENAVFAVAWGRDLAQKMRELFMRYERLKLHTARERVMHYLATQPCNGKGVTLEFSTRTWAHELGLTHESLYRTLAVLEKEGVLTRNGRHLEPVLQQDKDAAGKKAKKLLPTRRSSDK
jgi:CRP-like cAMP-binding protein